LAETLEKSSMKGDLRQDDAERATVLIAYGLMLVSVFNGITALIAVVLAYVRVGDMRDSVWESHYRNIITMFWISVALAVLLIASALNGLLAVAGLALGSAWMDGDAMLALPLLGLWVPLVMLAWLGFGLWFLYRGLRGLIRALDGRAF
jgi:uncharacterized membrane protein